jgi:hypothetical protein
MMPLSKSRSKKSVILSLFRRRRRRWQYVTLSERSEVEGLSKDQTRIASRDVGELSFPMRETRNEKTAPDPARNEAL